MEIAGVNIVGHKLSKEGNVQFKTFNPEKFEENEWLFTEVNQDEIKIACELAAKASTIYRKVSGAKRAEFLETIIRYLEKNREELIAVFQAESGLTEQRAEIELTRTIFQIQTYADLVKNNWPEKIVDPANPNREGNPKPLLVKSTVPLGTIVVFGASNFPFAYSTIGGDSASALAAGCPVIVKSHPMHAGTGELVAKCVQAAAIITNMPNGVFSNLNIQQNEIAEKLIMNSAVKGIGFTGSISGGRAIYDIAAKRKDIIPVFAEMGSTNPVVISENSLQNHHKWANMLADSLVNGNGQFCTCPGMIFAVESVDYDLFKADLKAELKQKAPQYMLHPSIKRSFCDLAGQLAPQELDQTITDLLVNPSLVELSGTAFISNQKAREEVFGPFAVLVTCASFEELLACIKVLDGQLTGTLIAEESELNDFQALIDIYETKVGRIIFNGVPTGVEVSPAMTHGGPYPASTDARFTAVGPDAIKRWIRPITYQNIDQNLI